MAAALSDPGFRRLNHRAVECLYCRPEVSEISAARPVTRSMLATTICYAATMRTCISVPEPLGKHV